MVDDNPLSTGRRDAPAKEAAAGVRDAATPEATWFYRRGLREIGPVTTSEVAGLLADGRLGASTYLMRTNRERWRPAAYWPEFDAVLARVLRGRRLPDGAFATWHLSYFRKRCLTMFGLFLAVVLMIAAHATASLLTPGPRTPRLFACAGVLLWMAAAGAGFYAMAFLRRAWRHVAALPVPIAIMGFVGCIGLMALTVLTGLAVVGFVMALIW